MIKDKGSVEDQTKKKTTRKKSKSENDNEKKKANYKYNKRVQSCAVWI